VNKAGDGVLYDKAQLTSAYQYFEESRNSRDFNSEDFFRNEEMVDAISGNLDFEKNFLKNKLYYGAEYVFNKVHSNGTKTNISNGEVAQDLSRYPDGSSWQSLASYISFHWRLDPTLVLQTGARYSHVILRADFTESAYDFPFNNADLNTGALTGSAGLSWEARRNLTWKLNFSTAFRAPNIDDIGKIFDSEPGSVVVPNPDLDPEYAYNGELGFNWEISKTVTLDIASFYTHLTNAMVRKNYRLNNRETMNYQGEDSRIQAIQNVAEAYVYGVEGGIKIKFSPAMHFSSQITYTHGEEEQEDGTTKPLRHAAPLFGNAHLVWKSNKVLIDLYSEYNDQFDFDELAPSEQGKAYLYALDENGKPYAPSWYTLNISGQYKMDENWKIIASLENITDQRYRTYSSGISAAGRNLILALKYSF
jgi:hemoglobin/transferrin/lactoferrin receptor protein